VQVGDAAAAAAQMLAQLYSRKLLAVAGNEIGGVQHAPVFAAPTDSDESHLGAHQFAKRAADAGLAGVAIARAHHLVRRVHGAGTDSMEERRPQSPRHLGGWRGASQGIASGRDGVYPHQNENGTHLRWSCGDGSEPAGIASRGSRGCPGVVVVA
jgi:hypothetical protein